MPISFREYLKNISDSQGTARVGKVYKTECLPANEEKIKPITKEVHLPDEVEALKTQHLRLKTQKAKLSNALVDDVIMEEQELVEGNRAKIGKLAISKIIETHEKNRAAIYAKIEESEMQERAIGRKIAYINKNNKMPEEAPQTDMRTAKPRPEINLEDPYAINLEITRLSVGRSEIKKKLPMRPKGDPKIEEWNKKITDYTQRIDELRAALKKLVNV